MEPGELKLHKTYTDDVEKTVISFISSEGDLFTFLRWDGTEYINDFYTGHEVRTRIPPITPPEPVLEYHHESLLSKVEHTIGQLVDMSGDIEPSQLSQSKSEQAYAMLRCIDLIRGEIENVITENKTKETLDNDDR